MDIKDKLLIKFALFTMSSFYGINWEVVDVMRYKIPENISVSNWLIKMKDEMDAAAYTALRADFFRDSYCFQCGGSGGDHKDGCIVGLADKLLMDYGY